MADIISNLCAACRVDFKSVDCKAKRNSVLRLASQVSQFSEDGSEGSRQQLEHFHLSYLLYAALA